MNILVGFSIEPEVEKLIGNDWLVENGLDIDTSFLKPILNSYDESALEMALRLMPEFQNALNPIVLTALTLANKGAGPILRTLNALPFDQIVHIEHRSDLRFAPKTVAAILSQYVQDHARQDLLLLGQQSSIGANAKTHLLVAEMLGWPCITRVIQITSIDSNQLQVISQADGGQLRQRINTPCVLSIGDAPNTYLRVPTLKDRMHLGGRAMTILPLDMFDLPQETEVLTNLQVIQNRRQAVFLEYRSPEETAQELFDEHLKNSLPSKSRTGRR